ARCERPSVQADGGEVQLFAVKAQRRAGGRVGVAAQREMRFDPRLGVAEVEVELDLIDQEIRRPVFGEAGRLRRLVERGIEHDNGTISGVTEGKRGEGRGIAAAQGGKGEALYLLALAGEFPGAHRAEPEGAGA